VTFAASEANCVTLRPLAADPVVSIVTPSYNQGRFVEATITSVLSQDYPRVEYFVCDGGSRDGSVDVIRRHAHRLTWWCSESDRGQSDAINKGWARATGDILAYLNSDDVLLPGAITRVVDVFRAHPTAGVVHGDWICIDEQGIELGKGAGRPTDLLRLRRHGQSRYIVQPAAFFRGDLVRRLGGVDGSLRLSMDYDLLLRLAREAALVHVPSPLAAYRVHTNAKTSAFVEAHWRETLAVQRRHGAPYLSTQRLLYWRYRAFASLPLWVQLRFRRVRNGSKDWAILRATAHRRGRSLPP
jgi:glycosyltransferase involved in cell wall biosynthesis